MCLKKIYLMKVWSQNELKQGHIIFMCHVIYRTSLPPCICRRPFLNCYHLSQGLGGTGAPDLGHVISPPTHSSFLNPTGGGVFVYGQRAGVDSTTPTFISSQTIQWPPKYIYIISRTFPITSRNPHDPIYKTPSVAVSQTWPSLTRLRGRKSEYSRPRKRQN